MNEHLVNNAEQFRNKVIEVNKKLASIISIKKDLDNRGLHKSNIRSKITLQYLKLQDELNNLYRQDRESLYK